MSITRSIDGRVNEISSRVAVYRGMSFRMCRKSWYMGRFMTAAMDDTVVMEQVSWEICTEAGLICSRRRIVTNNDNLSNDGEVDRDKIGGLASKAVSVGR